MPSLSPRELSLRKHNLRHAAASHTLFRLAANIHRRIFLNCWQWWQLQGIVQEPDVRTAKNPGGTSVCLSRHSGLDQDMVVYRSLSQARRAVQNVSQHASATTNLVQSENRNVLKGGGNDQHGIEASAHKLQGASPGLSFKMGSDSLSWANTAGSANDPGLPAVRATGELVKQVSQGIHELEYVVRRMKGSCAL